MKNSYLLSCILSFLMFSCQKEVRSTPELNQIFNVQEIEDINLIVEYFERSIQKLTDIKNIDIAFTTFAEKNLKNDFFYFDKFEHESIAQLYDDIDTETFDNIWEYNKGFNYRINDSIKVLSIAYEKKYMNYLSLVGEKNPKIEYLVNKIKNTGYLSGYLMYTLYQDFDEEGMNPIPAKEFGDFNNRVITAISTITILEEIHEEEIVQKKLSKQNE